jgi:hypothetical protein
VVTLTRMPSASPITAPTTSKSHVLLKGRSHSTARARGGSEAHCPLAEDSAPSTFCRLLSAWSSAPELERARVVRYRAVRTMVLLSLRLPAPCGATDGFL